MWTLEEKQKYLREHLEQDQFEEFFEFLEEDVGDFNIENWANEFIIKVSMSSPSWFTSSRRKRKRTTRVSRPLSISIRPIRPSQLSPP